MNDDNPKLNDKAVEKIRELRVKRQELMVLEPQEAMDRILKDPQPAALVHSFPEQDLYFLIHDIGPEDAGPLLSLASNRQWDHFMDLESWQKDRIYTPAVSRWLDLLLEADPSRFTDWFLNEKLEFVEFFLYQNIEVRVREHDQDPAEFGKDFFSLDNTYFIRFLDSPADDAANELAETQRKKFIARLIEMLADYDHHIFQGVLLEATHVIPAETEENCYRWRNLRLAEKGFLPFDEAIGIYQPIKPEDLIRMSAKVIPSARDPESRFPVPHFPLRMLGKTDNFTNALMFIESENVMGHLQSEFAHLCNRIIAADRKSMRDREHLREIVKKACGYLSIGLQRLTPGEKNLKPGESAALIGRHPLSQIFRVGFREALKLKWTAERWLDRCWFAKCDLRLTFWGEQWLGVLGGLLIKKPLFYDNYKSGVLYRDFASLEDVKVTENNLNQIKAIDDLLALMSIDIDRPASYGFLTYKNLMLTLWAADYLEIPAGKLKPLKLDDFKPFFEELLPESSSGDPGRSRAIPSKMKERFLNWLEARTGLKDFEITEQAGRTLEDLFNEIENELGRVGVRDLDPRYVQLFLLDD